jgi:hypothetical protein
MKGAAAREAGPADAQGADRSGEVGNKPSGEGPDPLLPTRWKNHDAYSNALDRLLRDLRVEKA